MVFFFLNGICEDFKTTNWAAQQATMAGGYTEITIISHMRFHRFWKKFQELTPLFKCLLMARGSQHYSLQNEVSTIYFKIAEEVCFRELRDMTLTYIKWLSLHERSTLVTHSYKNAHQILKQSYKYLVNAEINRSVNATKSPRITQDRQLPQTCHHS